MMISVLGSARRNAVARPMPDVAPVTRIRFIVFMCLNLFRVFRLGIIFQTRKINKIYSTIKHHNTKK
jgi:hypothetical protein